MADEPTNEREGEFSKAYTQYALALLLIVYIFNFIKRIISINHYYFLPFAISFSSAVLTK